MTGNQRQPRRSRLGFDQFPSHGVHRHPVERLVERGQEPDDFEVGLLAKDVERPGAILAGTPGEQDFGDGTAHGLLSGRTRQTERGILAGISGSLTKSPSFCTSRAVSPPSAQ